MCNIMLCNKSCGEAGRRGDIQRILFVFPNHYEVCQGPGDCKYLPVHGKWRMNFVLFCLHTDFVLPLKLLLSQHTSFHVFTLLIVSPISLWQSEMWHGAELPAKAEPQPVPKAGSVQCQESVDSL